MSLTYPVSLLRHLRNQQRVTCTGLYLLSATHPYFPYFPSLTQLLLQVSPLAFARFSYSWFRFRPLALVEDKQGFIDACKSIHTGSTLSPTTTPAADFDIGKDFAVPFRLPLSEAYNDFYGLPSTPKSIFHTGPAWPLPTGPEAQRIPKETRPVCDHAIAPVWHKLGKQIYEHFDSVALKWTSIDPVRFAEAEGKAGPLFLWVGVMPSTLSRGDAEAAATRCKEILAEYEIMDVEIAFRESVFTQSARPRLLDYVPFNGPIADVHSPFSPVLGLQIAPKGFFNFEGTGCLYLCEGGDSKRVFLLTARHVVLPPSEHSNNLYHRKDNSIPRLDVIHLGNKAYQTALGAIMSRIGGETIMIDHYKDELDELGAPGNGEKARTTITRQLYESKLAKAERSKVGANKLYNKIARFWTLESQRVLGHVLYAPPISVSMGDKEFSEDWALVELNRGKFDWEAFRGNVINLGTKFPLAALGEFMHMMYPDRESRAQFHFPKDGFMQLRGHVKDGELRCSTMLDANGERCVIVVKNGTSTGVTLGRASGIESFVRTYKEHRIHSTSMEIAIHPYSYKSGAFSAPGDSGSVIGEANSRIVGMITGGTGKTNRIDVTYVTPYYFLDKQIKAAFPNSHLYPGREIDRW